MTTPSAAVEIYCVKCKTRTGSKDIEAVTIRPRSPARPPAGRAHAARWSAWSFWLPTWITGRRQYITTFLLGLCTKAR